MPRPLFSGFLILALVASPLQGDEDQSGGPSRVLLVTHAGGYIHQSLLTAEQVLKKIGPKHGLQFTCYRFSGDPDAKTRIKRGNSAVETTALEDYSARFRARNGEPVTRKHCGRVNKETLQRFDAVVFFTTSTWSPDRGSHPLTDKELEDLILWVKAGGSFVGVHCASDTLHNTPYGELVGAFFAGHPWVKKVKVRVEDPEHPAGKAFSDGDEILHEVYQFGDKPNYPAQVPIKRQPYSRDRLHIIMSVNNRSIDVKKGNREDGDYPISWCQRFGKGRSFYTALGHHKEIWKDPRFQEHLLGGLKWSLRELPGEATSSANLKQRK